MGALKVALIGAGNVGRAHLAAWLALGAEVSVYSGRQREMLSGEKALRVCPTFADAVSRAEVVDICSPTDTHLDYSLRAITAGKDVICEKPLALSSDEAVRVLNAARDTGVNVFPGHVVRYFPEYVAAQEAITTGTIGRLGVMRFTTVAPAPDVEWFFDETRSGGIVFDLLIHGLDMARSLGGEVVRVYAQQNPPAIGGKLAPRTAAQVVLTHRSKAISLVSGAWTDSGVEFSSTFDISGSTGRLHYDSRRTAPLSGNVAQRPGREPYLPPAADGDPWLAELRSFVSALNGGHPARVNLVDGVVAVVIAEAAARSLQSGGPIAVDEAAVLRGAVERP